jgi:putative membrane protein
MFIDYLTIQLAAAAAGLFFTAIYGGWYLEAPLEARRSWAWLFWVLGAILGLTALDTVLTWPLPGPYNIVFGEPALWFGSLLFAAGFAIYGSSDPLPLSLLASVGGLIILLCGVDILNDHLTSQPTLAFIAYLASGLGALLLPLGLRSRSVRPVVQILLVLSAVIFAVTGGGAYLQHAHDFAKWLPPLMRSGGAH